MTRFAALASVCLAAGCIDFGELVPTPTLSTDPDPATATETGTLDTQTEPVVVEVLISDLAFTPSDIVIAVGTTVRWNMQDTGTFHFVTEGNPNGDPAFVSPRLDVGDSWERTFTEPGSFVYHCSNHTTVMRGATITVE